MKFYLQLVLTLFVTFFIAKANAQDSNQLEDLTIIMPSYDKYSELWDPTFKLLFKHWPNLLTDYKDVPLVLVSNYEKFEHPRVKNILIGDLDKTWSENFLKSLDKVKTKYVLIILDDYIMSSPVNDKRLVEILSFLKKNNGAYIEIS